MKVKFSTASIKYTRDFLFQGLAAVTSGHLPQSDLPLSNPFSAYLTSFIQNNQTFSIYGGLLCILLSRKIFLLKVFRLKTPLSVIEYIR